MPNTPAIQSTIQKGYVTYCLDERLSIYPGFRAQAHQVAAEGLYTTQISAYEVGCWESPDARLMAPDDQTFINICGQGAAGCITYWTRPANIYLRLALNYNSTSGWRTTIAHEGLNAGHLLGQHEGYNDLTFSCTRQTDTIMDCGSGQWVPQLYKDIFAIWNIVIPDQPSQAGSYWNDHWFNIWWNGYRADGGQAHHGNNKLDNVTQVAVFQQFPGDSNWYWTGYYGDPSPAGSYRERGFERWYWCSVPGTRFGIRPENGLSLTHYGNIPYISGDITDVGACPAN